MADGGVHLLLVHVLDLGGGAAQDALLLLLGQRLGDHLDGLGPFVPAGHNDRLNYEQAALCWWSTVASTVGSTEIFRKVKRTLSRTQRKRRNYWLSNTELLYNLDR